MGVIVLLVALQTLSTVVLVLHVAFQLDLARLAARHRRRDVPASRGPAPRVTVQLPVFNERHLADRAIAAAVRLDYPPEKLEIQVLDDSADDTPAIVASSIARHAAGGVRIRHVRRDDRTGYKAGALARGLDLAAGELIAVFDADFLPDPDFLRRVVPSFGDSAVAAVQSRWGYENRRQSILTQAQALILDNHFGVEQLGRAVGGYFTTFNGSGGVWRAAAIRDAGGWRWDTLTEDLDLSYRAQLRGWRLRYLDAIVTPSELPADFRAYRVQQYRWIKGTAQNARKHLAAVLAAPVALGTRLHAAAHLLESSVYLAILALVLSTAGLGVARAWERIGAWPFLHPGVLLGALGLLVVYFVSQRGRIRSPVDMLTYLGTWATFFVLTTGMTVHNGCAVVAGYLGRGGEFVRTPKAASFRAGEGHAERVSVVPWLLVAELACLIFLLAAVVRVAAAGQAMLAWLPVVTLIGLTAVIAGSVVPSWSLRAATGAVRRAARRVAGGTAS